MHNSCLGISPKYLIFRNTPKPIIDPYGISFLCTNFETFTIFSAIVLKGLHISAVLEDLAYFMILRYKLRDFIKIFDDYVNDPIKGDVQKALLLFQIGRKSFVEYQWLWPHTTHESLLGLSSMIDNQMV